MLFCSARLFAAETPRTVGEFVVKEPLGMNWSGEWLTVEVDIRAGERKIPAERLQVARQDGSVCPAQFNNGERLLGPGASLTGTSRVRVLFLTSVGRNTAERYQVRVAEQTPEPKLVALQVKNGPTVVSNSYYAVVFDPAAPLPFNAVRTRMAGESLGTFTWPDGVVATAVEHTWMERGPARVLLRRTFRFQKPEHSYELTLDFRADDPWIGVTERYGFGEGTAVEFDLRAMKADTVHHPYAYNARTFKPGGPQDDSTLQPPQHPIATLGPIWRDIWFNGGPYAFVYRSDDDRGIGFAAVKGSQWETREGVSKASQNLQVNGDSSQPGQVRVRFPADGGVRHWAMVIGPAELRKAMGTLVRSHADIPLDRVLNEWVLDWPSSAETVDYPFANNWFGPYNRHALNPTTFPRNVRKFLDELFLPERKKVKSRDLAFLAYVFTDPNYWPGPDMKWGNVGNPNFHTDMYNVPLKIGLLMPDHPHAGRWVQYGVEETSRNLMRDSFPGGAWAESLSYSGFFFHIVENAVKLRNAGAAQPFRDWPRFKEVAHFLAAMHTPPDPRYGKRQIAPIGDTSPGDYIRQLHEMADVYRGLDDRFAEQLARFPEPGEGALNISSRAFPGFGAMLRGNAYSAQHESFVTVKAGPARNHYQGDELSFHFASLGTPLAIDYACHYSPRPWSASIHNRPDMDGLRPVAIGEPRAFVKSERADVFVADEQTWTINQVPMVPHETIKPGWEYPTTKLPQEQPWLFRRYTMLVKHDPTKSRIADYLVVRDEIRSPRPVWQNLHFLARKIEQQTPARYFFPGQLGVDTTVSVFGPKALEVEKRYWGWKGSGNERRSLKGAEYEQKLMGEMIPETFEAGTWSYEKGGELGQWLRIKGPAGQTSWMMVLMPNRKGTSPPEVKALGDTVVEVTLGSEREIIYLGSEGEHQAAVQQDGKTQVLLARDHVAPWSKQKFSNRSYNAERGKE